MRSEQEGSETVDSTANVAEIADVLRDQIIKGDLRPGARIFEAKIARQMGVSRAPVREAARILESEGLLVARLNKGFTVNEFTIRDLKELMDTRICIERHAIRTIMQGTLLPNLLAKLDGITEVIDSCVEAGDFAGEIEADFSFHRTIVEFSQNRRLLHIYDQAAAEQRICLRMMGSIADNWRELPQLHRDLIAAIGSANLDTVEEVLTAHIKFSWQETLDILEARVGIRLEPGIRR